MRSARRAFTLIEVLVSMAVLSLLLVLTLAIVDQTRRAFSSTSAQVEAFQSAETAFETITRKLSQATLNTYFDYYDGPGGTGNRRDPAAAESFQPKSYGRASDLHFVTGPARDLLASTNLLVESQAVFFCAALGYAGSQTAQGLEKTLNACGFFVEFGDQLNRPSFLAGPERWRYRLMEMSEPTELLSIFTGQSPNDWFTNPLSLASPPFRKRILAENVIGLFLIPKATIDDAETGLAPAFAYDTRAGSSVSRHQLPPIVRVYLVAIDEASASRLAKQYGKSPPPLIPPGAFASADRVREDLKELEASLTELNVSHRVFVTDVALRSAKWSAD